jgi:hypothetical protein
MVMATMAVTKRFKELLQRRVASDAALATNMLSEAIDTMLASDVETGTLLRGGEFGRRNIIHHAATDGRDDSYVPLVRENRDLVTIRCRQNSEIFERQMAESKSATHVERHPRKMGVA